MKINANISNSKRAIRATENRIRTILIKEPRAKAAFNAILKKHKPSMLGFFASNPPANLGAEEKSWYESDFAMDLFDFGKTAIMLDQVNGAERKALELELKKIQEQNAALDKQIVLNSRGAGAYGGSFVNELMNSPVKLAAIGGLAYYFFMQRKPKTRRRR